MEPIEGSALLLAWIYCTRTALRKFLEEWYGKPQNSRDSSNAFRFCGFLKGIGMDDRRILEKGE